MLVIGLTGGIGSGKSTAADLFTAKGIQVVDTDQLAREVVAPGSTALQAIAAHFGPDILDTDGNLRRAELRRIVFADAEQRRWLEALLHPLIASLMQQRIAACSSPYCMIESPLLLETSQHELADRVLVIDVSEATQLQRTEQRDGSDPATIKAIIDAQMSRDARLAKADDVITNNQGLAELRQAVDDMHNRYLQIARDKT